MNTPYIKIVYDHIRRTTLVDYDQFDAIGIAKLTGMTNNQASASLSKLKELDFVRVVGKTGQALVYRRKRFELEGYRFRSSSKKDRTVSRTPGYKSEREPVAADGGDLFDLPKGSPEVERELDESSTAPATPVPSFQPIAGRLRDIADELERVEALLDQAMNALRRSSRG